MAASIFDARPSWFARRGLWWLSRRVVLIKGPPLWDDVGLKRHLEYT